METQWNYLRGSFPHHTFYWFDELAVLLNGGLRTTIFCFWQILIKSMRENASFNIRLVMIKDISGGN